MQFGPQSTVLSFQFQRGHRQRGLGRPNDLVSPQPQGPWGDPKTACHFADLCSGLGQYGYCFSLECFVVPLRFRSSFHGGGFLPYHPCPSNRGKIREPNWRLPGRDRGRKALRRAHDRRKIGRYDKANERRGEGRGRVLRCVRSSPEGKENEVVWFRKGWFSRSRFGSFWSTVAAGV